MTIAALEKEDLLNWSDEHKEEQINKKKLIYCRRTAEQCGKQLTTELLYWKISWADELYLKKAGKQNF